VTRIRLEPNILKTALAYTYVDSLLWRSTVGYTLATAWLLVKWTHTQQIQSQ